MPKASDLTLDGYNSFLFKGPQGFGKTLAAASFALEGPVEIAYFDKKKPIELLTFFSLPQFGELGKRILDNISYTVYSSENCNEYLNSLIKLSKDCRLYAHITDSVTTLTASAVNWSIGFRGNAPKKDKLNNNTVQLIPDFDEYKVETSLVTQSLDICRTLPCHVIWIAHPLPSIKVEGSGNSIKVTKTNPIVTYGSKVAGIIPGQFSEIYHFSQASEWDGEKGVSIKKFICAVDSVGDEFAKSPLLGHKIKEFDITNKLFYPTWKEELTK